MQLERKAIKRVLGEACASLLGVDFALATEVSRVEGEATTTACVPFTGAWNGAISIECSAAFARRISTLMFEMEDSELSDEEVRDAMGELANVLAGTFKRFLPVESKLSLPTVAWGLSYSLSMPNTVLDSEFFYQCESYSCIVRTLKVETKC